MVTLLTRHPDAVLTERTEPRTYREFPVAFDLGATYEDIRLGVQAQATTCALARAAKRTLGLDDDTLGVTVCEGELHVWNGAFYVEYDLGAESINWTERFDLGLPVQPVTFRAVKVREGAKT